MGGAAVARHALVDWGGSFGTGSDQTGSIKVYSVYMCMCYMCQTGSVKVGILTGSSPTYYTLFFYVCIWNTPIKPTISI
jgi:hypothetical protein